MRRISPWVSYGCTPVVQPRASIRRPGKGLEAILQNKYTILPATLYTVTEESLGAGNILKETSENL